MYNVLLKAKTLLAKKNELNEFILNWKSGDILEIKHWDSTHGISITQTNRYLYANTGNFNDDELLPYEETLRNILFQAISEEKDDFFMIKQKESINKWMSNENETELIPFGKKAEKLWKLLSVIDKRHFLFNDERFEIFKTGYKFSLKLPFLHAIPIRFDFDNMSVRFDRKGPYVTCKTEEEVQTFYEKCKKENQEMINLLHELKNFLQKMDETCTINLDAKTMNWIGWCPTFTLEGGEWFGKPYYKFQSTVKITGENGLDDFKKELFSHYQCEFNTEKTRYGALDKSKLHFKKFSMEKCSPFCSLEETKEQQFSTAEFIKLFKNGYDEEDIYTYNADKNSLFLSYLNNEPKTYTDFVINFEDNSPFLKHIKDKSREISKVMEFKNYIIILYSYLNGKCMGIYKKEQ